MVSARRLCEESDTLAVYESRSQLDAGSLPRDVFCEQTLAFVVADSVFQRSLFLREDTQ